MPRTIFAFFLMVAFWSRAATSLHGSTHRARSPKPTRSPANQVSGLDWTWSATGRSGWETTKRRTSIGLIWQRVPSAPVLTPARRGIPLLASASRSSLHASRSDPAASGGAGADARPASRHRRRVHASPHTPRPGERAAAGLQCDACVPALVRHGGADVDAHGLENPLARDRGGDSRIHLLFSPCCGSESRAET